MFCRNCGTEFLTGERGEIQEEDVRIAAELLLRLLYRCGVPLYTKEGIKGALEVISYLAKCCPHPDIVWGRSFRQDRRIPRGGTGRCAERAEAWRMREGDAQ